ncbi:MAG: G-D-S-L family lipolytic protein [Aphanothece sp. CMT-3BRIN-NPC111]|jgi:lysophospholipase L1-like esterase|nr:G-D-S-L family lipolytic protein [Aphanothece sp. CMT-3BRIN-NPC111]
MQTLVAPAFNPLYQANCHPLKIVVLGDSIVYGFGDPEGGGWVERLRRQWMMPGSPGHVVYNLGVRGDGLKQVGGRLEQEFRHRGELKNRVPDVIMLSVGVNDSARLGRPDGRHYTDFEVFKAELASLLNLCVAMQHATFQQGLNDTRSQRQIPVLFVGMVPVNEAKMPFLDCFHFNHADQYRYKEATRLACQAHQIPYLDIFDLWLKRGAGWWQKQLCEDGLHPNVTGYQALLQDILNWEPVAQLAQARLAAS